MYYNLFACVSVSARDVTVKIWISLNTFFIQNLFGKICKKNIKVYFIYINVFFLIVLSEHDNVFGLIKISMLNRTWKQSSDDKQGRLSGAHSSELVWRFFKLVMHLKLNKHCRETTKLITINKLRSFIYNLSHKAKSLTDFSSDATPPLKTTNMILQFPIIHF